MKPMLVLLALALARPTHAYGAEKSVCGPVPPGGQMDENCRITLAPPPLTHFKGVELFSWRDGGRWYFSLVEGRNRDQDRAEVLRSRVQGVSALKGRLRQVVRGTELFWNTRVVPGMQLSLPSRSVVTEIRELCRQSGLELISGSAH